MNLVSLHIDKWELTLCACIHSNYIKLFIAMVSFHVIFVAVGCYSVDFNWVELVVETTQVSSKRRRGLTVQLYFEAADQTNCYERTTLAFKFTADW